MSALPIPARGRRLESPPGTCFREGVRMAFVSLGGKIGDGVVEAEALASECGFPLLP